MTNPVSADDRANALKTVRQALDFVQATPTKGELGDRISTAAIYIAKRLPITMALTSGALAPVLVELIKFGLDELLDDQGDDHAKP